MEINDLYFYPLASVYPKRIPSKYSNKGLKPKVLDLSKELDPIECSLSRNCDILSYFGLFHKVYNKIILSNHKLIKKFSNGNIPEDTKDEEVVWESNQPEDYVICVEARIIGTYWNNRRITLVSVDNSIKYLKYQDGKWVESREIVLDINSLNTGKRYKIFKRNNLTNFQANDKLHFSEIVEKNSENNEIVTIWRGDSDHRYCKVVSLFEMSNGNKVMAMLFLGNNLLIYYFDGIWKLKADSLKNNDLKPRLDHLSFPHVSIDEVFEFSSIVINLFNKITNPFSQNDSNKTIDKESVTLENNPKESLNEIENNYMRPFYGLEVTLRDMYLIYRIYFTTSGHYADKSYKYAFINLIYPSTVLNDKDSFREVDPRSNFYQNTPLYYSFYEDIDSTNTGNTDVNTKNSNATSSESNNGLDQEYEYFNAVSGEIIDRKTDSVTVNDVKIRFFSTHDDTVIIDNTTNDNYNEDEVVDFGSLHNKNCISDNSCCCFDRRSAYIKYLRKINDKREKLLGVTSVALDINSTEPTKEYFITKSCENFEFKCYSRYKFNKIFHKSEEFGEKILWEDKLDTEYANQVFLLHHNDKLCLFILSETLNCRLLILDHDYNPAFNTLDDGIKIDLNKFRFCDMDNKTIDIFGMDKRDSCSSFYFRYSFPNKCYFIYYEDKLVWSHPDSLESLTNEEKDEKNLLHIHLMISSALNSYQTLSQVLKFEIKL
eukprot:XP_765706.1 hypothetical protein [Theileria parva strain Muguga]